MRRVAGRVFLTGLVAAAACADPSGPATHTHPQRILIAGTEDGAVVVDLDWRGIIRRSGPRFAAQGSSVLNGRGALLTVGRLEDSATVMAGLDVETGLELWRTAISQGTTPDIVDGVELGAAMIAANPSRPEVFLWRAGQNGVIGIAGYDYDKRRVTRFFGPVGNRFRAMAATPATAAHPEGCLVMALDADLDPGPALNLRASFHVVCGTEYAERDSISIALPSRQVLQMEMSADGRDLIVMTDLELLKLDAATMQVKLKASRPMVAPFFVSRATGRLIIADVGSTVVASTGIIYLLDADLELSSIIDLRVLPFGERPLGILGAEESRDGRWLYIVGGVPRDGPLYGPEKTHVLVIDKGTGLVIDTVNLDTFGGGRPILVP
jgi:hypothetical protein